MGFIAEPQDKYSNHSETSGEGIENAVDGKSSTFIRRIKQTDYVYQYCFV